MHITDITLLQMHAGTFLNESMTLNRPSTEHHHSGPWYAQDATWEQLPKHSYLDGGQGLPAVGLLHGVQRRR